MQELFLQRVAQWLVSAVVHLLAAAGGGPQVGHHLLAETLGGGTNDADLLLDRLQEAFIRAQLLAGVAVLDLGFVHVRFGVIQVVLEQVLGLLLE